LLAIVLSVLQFTVSDYPFGIFKRYYLDKTERFIFAIKTMTTKETINIRKILLDVRVSMSCFMRNNRGEGRDPISRFNSATCLHTVQATNLDSQKYVKAEILLIVIIEFYQIKPKASTIILDSTRGQRKTLRVNNG
jgi:hypothetical protein